MRLLLDSHTFLWFAAGDVRLSDNVRRLIEDTDNERFLSAASIWEIGIKSSTGKLILAEPIERLLPQEMRRNRIDLLPITLDHVIRVSQLPYHHRDPFDRMLAAQSLVEGMPLLSVDAMLDNYGVTRLW